MVTSMMVATVAMEWGVMVVAAMIMVVGVMIIDDDDSYIELSKGVVTSR